MKDKGAFKAFDRIIKRSSKGKFELKDTLWDRSFDPDEVRITLFARRKEGS